MVATYSDSQRKYWTQKPAGVTKFMTVEFYHPDFGYIRLVANQFFNEFFDVDGSQEEFQAVSMEVPQVTNQSTDSTQAGSITFGRIGTSVRSSLMSITPLGAIKYPITTTLRQYESGVNIYQRQLYVGREGISINADSVNVVLSVDNPAKLANEQLFYDPSVWVGLQFG